MNGQSSTEDKPPTEELLWKVFDNVNRWLDFAEKKNGVILFGWGLIGVLFSEKLRDRLGFTCLVQCLSSAAVIIFFVAWLYALFSFLPRTKIDYALVLLGNESKKPNPPGDNLLFFGDIAKYDRDSYLAALQDEYGTKSRSDRTAGDLCSQAIQNANIALRKYRCFTRAMVLTALAAGLLVVSVFI